jgi:hypothetical protein
LAGSLAVGQNEYVASILNRHARLPGLMWDLDNIVLADQILWRIAPSAWQIVVIAVGVAASEG